MTTSTTVQDSLSVSDIVEKAESDGGKLILLYLARVKEAAVRDIAKALDITLSKTYSIIKQLKERGVVKHISDTTYRLTL